MTEELLRGPEAKSGEITKGEFTAEEKDEINTAAQLLFDNEGYKAGRNEDDDFQRGVDKLKSLNCDLVRADTLGHSMNGPQEFAAEVISEGKIVDIEASKEDTKEPETIDKSKEALLIRRVIKEGDVLEAEADKSDIRIVMDNASPTGLKAEILSKQGTLVEQRILEIGANTFSRTNEKDIEITIIGTAQEGAAVKIFQEGKTIEETDAAATNTESLFGNSEVNSIENKASSTNNFEPQGWQGEEPTERAA